MIVTVAVYGTALQCSVELKLNLFELWKKMSALQLWKWIHWVGASEFRRLKCSSSCKALCSGLCPCNDKGFLYKTKYKPWKLKEKSPVDSFLKFFNLRSLCHRRTFTVCSTFYWKRTIKLYINSTVVMLIDNCINFYTKKIKSSSNTPITHHVLSGYTIIGNDSHNDKPISQHTKWKRHSRKRVKCGFSFQVCVCVSVSVCARSNVPRPDNDSPDVNKQLILSQQSCYNKTAVQRLFVC